MRKLFHKKNQQVLTLDSMLSGDGARAYSRSNPLTKFGISACLIWSITLLFSLLQFFAQLTTGALAGPLIHTFHISELGLGFLVASYYLVYVPMQGPAGMLLDQYGPRRLLAVGALVFALGTLLFALSPSFYLAVLGRMVMGVGASFAFVGSVKTASRLFPSRTVVRLTLVLELAGIMAVLFGNSFLSGYLQHATWQHAMLFLAILAFMIAPLIWVSLRDSNLNSAGTNALTARLQRSPTQVVLRRMGWKKCLFCISRRRAMWTNGFYCGALFSFVGVFTALWGVEYLQDAKGITRAASVQINNVLLLGVVLGIAFFIAIQDRIKNDLKTMSYIAYALGVLSLSFLFYTQLPIKVIEASLFLIGCLSPAYILSFKVCSRLLPESLNASSTGFTNMMMAAVAPIMQVVFGCVVFLLAKFLGHLHAEQSAMLLFPALLIIAGYLIRGIRVPKRKCSVSAVDKAT